MRTAEHVSTITNLSTINPAQRDVCALVWQRFIVSWSCLRRVQTNEPRSSHTRRLQLVLGVQPLEWSRVNIEGWVENGHHRRCVQPPLSRTARMSIIDHRLNIDIAEPAGDPLLALTIELESPRLLYAQSSLLRAAGFVDGTYDPPILLTAPHVVAVHSA